MLTWVTGSSRFLPFVDPIINVPDGITDISGQTEQSLNVTPGSSGFFGSVAIALHVKNSRLKNMQLIVEI